MSDRPTRVSTTAPSEERVPLTDEQHKVVRRVAERITRHPGTHRQEHWYEDGKLHAYPLWLAVYEESSPELVIDVEAMATCNTTACAAGHIILAALELGLPFDQGSILDRTISATAARLAGLSAQQAWWLFSEASESNVREAVSIAAEHGDWGHLQDWDPSPWA